MKYIVKYGMNAIRKLNKTALLETNEVRFKQGRKFRIISQNKWHYKLNILFILYQNYRFIIFCKYIKTAFSPAVLSPESFVFDISKSIQPQCPLKVGKQIIRRFLSISGL